MANLTHPELAEIRVNSLPPASVENLQTLRTEMCGATEFSLQPQQTFLRRVLSPDSPTRDLLMVHGTGVGKCHGIDTPILMYDGTIKHVQDILVGELLMGDDSTPRRVESLARGRDEMYRIKGVKGDSYVVNSEHILCLKYTGQSDVTEITVANFLAKSNKIQRNLKGYRVSVDFPSVPVSFDPYVLGVWLGDGSKRDPVISSQDAVILSYLRTFCSQNNAVLTYQSGYDYRVSAISNKHENVFLEFLKSNNLINNKHVPQCYKVNSREVRLQVLAGLVDTDGYLIHNVYEITQKSKQLADDIVFLARSVGLATTTRIVQKSCTYKGERRVGSYYRTFISGDIGLIPAKLLRKHAAIRKQIKDVCKYGISVEPLGVGDYYGFVIDANHRYLLGDFSVTHNTCSSIQIAEEYILRPEFQDKKVLIIAGPAVQSNFRTEIFDLTRTKLDEKSNMLSSKQCTGTRYLEMLTRVVSEPKQWMVPEVRIRLKTLADRMISEFYEFTGYNSFGARINEALNDLPPAEADKWIHDTFDNRLVIVDEAHNLREGGDLEVEKSVSSGMEKLVKTANGLVLVLLTATPMYESYEEIVYYMNLFGWNDRTLSPTKKLKASDYFNSDGRIKPAKESEFRDWCQRYVSFVKGENPFTFPFRLPPPNEAPDDRVYSFVGKSRGIADTERLKYLSVVASQVQGEQGKALGEEAGDEKDEEKRQAMMMPTVSVLPGNKKFKEVFKLVGDQYDYVDTPFLTPELLPNYAAKFVNIIKSIEAGVGVSMVYSNYVERGAKLFAMALEEHGYVPAAGGAPLLVGRKGTKGTYIMLTSEITTSQITTLLSLARDRKNMDGSLVRVILTTPKISEGVNFRFVRQVHILDPWWNMSRIEQVIGRGLRTCSHSMLPFEHQNCTVYLHVCRTTSKRECFDEYTYRTKVESKALKIGNVRKIMMESAMDCPIQIGAVLPQAWKELPVDQVRSENNERVTYPLFGMVAPQFMDDPEGDYCNVKPSIADPDYVRPLSSYTDVRDELLNRLSKLFVDKEIWERKQLFAALSMYQPDVVAFTLQSAIRTGFKFRDAFGRPSLLESRGDLYALSPIGMSNGTLVERTTQHVGRSDVPLPEVDATPKPAVTDAPDLSQLRTFPFPVDRFDAAVLDGYAFDHSITDAQRVLYIRSGQTTQFSSRLAVVGTDILVLGDDRYDPPEVEPGEPLTAVTKWTDDLLAHFDQNKSKIFASVKDGKLTISRFKMEGDTPVREAGKKRDVPIVCGTGENKKDAVLALAKYVDRTGAGVPAEVAKTNKETWCLYAELLLRTHMQDPEPKVIWYTPQEMETILSAKPKTKKTK